jgi:hypothetical protein
MSASRKQSDILNSLLGATRFPVSDKKFPVPIAGNPSKQLWCFNGFVQAGRGLSTKIPCIFADIREFQLAETRSLQPPSTATKATVSEPKIGQL